MRQVYKNNLDKLQKFLEERDKNNNVVKDEEDIIIPNPKDLVRDNIDEL